MKIALGGRSKAWADKNGDGWDTTRRSLVVGGPGLSLAGFLLCERRETGEGEDLPAKATASPRDPELTAFGLRSVM
jgi:hypothetical protein